MLQPDDLRTMAAFVRGQLLREAEIERLVAQLPPTRRPVRAMLAAWLHALADRLQPPTDPLPRVAPLHAQTRGQGG